MGSYSSYFLDMFYKLQKQVCRTVSPPFPVSFEPKAHRENVASLSIFCGHYFRKCSYKLALLVPLSFNILFLRNFNIFDILINSARESFRIQTSKVRLTTRDLYFTIAILVKVFTNCISGETHFTNHLEFLIPVV